MLKSTEVQGVKTATQVQMRDAGGTHDVLDLLSYI